MRLYHACHADELREILEDGELGLRSEWALELPEHGTWSAPGSWTGLNYFHQGNRYGPLLLSFPLNVLNRRNFMVFRRVSDRSRYFFIQYEARIPIYSFKKKLWRNVKPQSYFLHRKNSLSMAPGAIYEIVVTEPIGLDGITIKGVKHSSCISRKCGGLKASESRRIAQSIALERLHSWMKLSGRYEEFLEAFPDVVGESVDLDLPDDL